MEGQNRWKAAPWSAMERLDLPAGIAGAPVLELTANRELYMENHRGVLSYSTEAVEIHGGVLLVRVTGTALQLLAMTEEELRLGGRIDRIELAELTDGDV